MTGSSRNEDTGFDIRFYTPGAKRSLRGGEELIKLVPALPDLLRKARLISSQPDRRGRPSVRAVHRFAAAAELDGERVDLVLVVRETPDGKFHYSLHHDRGAGEAPEAGQSGRPKGDALEQRSAPNAFDGAPGDLNIARAPAGINGLRGKITLAENRAIVELFAGADRSTFMHEMGHLWLDELARDAARANVPQALKDDLGAVLRWLKVDKVEDIGVAQRSSLRPAR